MLSELSRTNAPVIQLLLHHCNGERDAAECDQKDIGSCCFSSTPQVEEVFPAGQVLLLPPTEAALAVAPVTGHLRAPCVT
jgi:hypothetical protein